MKQSVVVTFNFDSETQSVSDVKCSVGNVESKKKRTSTKKVKDLEIEEKAEITLEPTKIILNNKAALDMGIKYEDRVVIKWEKEGEKLVPIIGTDIAFGEEGAGNKVTKSNTVAYKGKSNTVLAEYGDAFSIESYKDGLWKLLPIGVSGTISNPTKTIEQVTKEAEKTSVDLIVNTDTSTVIDELDFTI